MQRTSQQEGVVIISEDGEPAYMVRKNGAVRYYKLMEMGFGDHIEMLGAERAVEHEFQRAPIKTNNQTYAYSTETEIV